MQWLAFEPQLPWETAGPTEQRFRLILGSLIALALIFAYLVARSVLPPEVRRPTLEVPQRFAKLVLENKKKIVSPPTPKEQQKPKVDKKKTENKPHKELRKRRKTVKDKPRGNLEKAKAEARRQMAVFDALADLRDISPISKIQKNRKLSSGLSKAKTLQRSLIVNRAKRGSGGIVTARSSRSMGGTGLSGGGSRTVTSNLAALKSRAGRRASGGGKAQRPSENIEQYMDANKAAIFALYNRALRKNPSLKGEVIFKLKILANGSVAAVRVVSSDLGDRVLERKLVARIRLINFGKMNVAAWEDNYRMTFLPS